MTLFSKYSNSIEALVLAMCVLVISSTTQAQQDPQVSMNNSVKLFYNPASAGMNDAICAYFLSRQQWVGFEGRPESYMFGTHGTFTIPGINLRSGGGLSIMTDALGQMRFFGLKGSYSAHIPVRFIGGAPGYLGIGAAVGMLQFSLGNNWRAVDPYYTDPRIPDEGFTANGLDLDLGLYYRTDKLYFGLSTMHVNSASYDGSGNKFETEFPGVAKSWSSNFQMTRHYYAMAGFDQALDNPLFILKPSVFIKSDLVSAQVDANLIVEWDNFIWGGATYRFRDAAIVMAGVNYRPVKGVFRFGYAYDITTSRIRYGSQGSHELFAQYCLQLKKKSPIPRHRTDRFL